MPIEIKPYEDWMKPQIVKLFSIQYGISENEFSSLMDDFYEHPFQKNKCLKIAAIDGNKVVGFQSYFYWPYTYNETIYNSYQSGNSLVHPEYRGKGIFQKLLSYLDNELQNKYKIDFLVGFPVEESKNSFLKNGWKNILNLHWYIKICNPLGFLFSFTHKYPNNKLPDSNRKKNDFNNCFRLTSQADFIHWRNDYSKRSPYFSYRYSDNYNEIDFYCRIKKRGKIFNELVIGDIKANNMSEDVFQNGLKELHRMSLSMKYITFISIAVNSESNFNFRSILKKSGFYKMNKQIFFIIKTYSDIPNISNPTFWMLFRSDIDTW